MGLFDDMIKAAKKPGPPLPDIAICSECGWRGLFSKCPMEEEGDYESGYYSVPVCPKCPDGGCLDDCDYSKEQLKLRNEYETKNS